MAGAEQINLDGILKGKKFAKLGCNLLTRSVHSPTQFPEISGGVHVVGAANQLLNMGFLLLTSIGITHRQAKCTSTQEFIHLLAHDIEGRFLVRDQEDLLSHEYGGQ